MLKFGTCFIKEDQDIAGKTINIAQVFCHKVTFHKIKNGRGNPETRNRNYSKTEQVRKENLSIKLSW